MFNGGTKAQSPRPIKKSDGGDNSVTILTSGCHFTGKLYCSGSTRIGGTIEGEIISEGVLIVEEKADIRADIQAEEVVIQGRVDGKVEAKIRLEICNTGRFSGDVSTPVLVIKEGAQFNGQSSMVVSGDICEDDRDSKTPEVSALLESIEKPSPEVSLL